MSIWERYDDLVTEMVEAREREAVLVAALTFMKEGPLASLLSAATEAPIGPDAMVTVPVDLVRHWDEVVSKALATVSAPVQKD